jgi:hypothetical protein
MHVGDLARDQRGIRHGRDPQRHVDPLVDEVDIAILQPQVERHLGVFLDIVVDGRRQRRLPEIARRRNPQQAARLGRLVGDRRIEVIELLQQCAGFAIIGLACLGEAQLARGAVHQPHAQIIFEVGHIFAEQRLGASMLPRCSGKPAGIKDLNESADAGKVLRHDCPFTLAT